jgi:WD40 repeat protein
MTLTEHSAVVTDLTFAANDSKLYSTAMDGSVYEWEVGRDSRISDFVVKGIPAIAVASSPLLTTIAVYYDSQEVAERKKAHHTVKKFASEKPIFQSARSISHIPLKKTPTVDSTNFGTQNSQGEAASRKMFLALFSNGRVLTSDSKIINFDIPVTCMSFGISEAPLQNRKLPGEIFVVGFADGRIMVSMLPVPLRIVEMNPLSRGSSTVLRSASSMPGILAEDDGDMTPATHSFHEDGSVDGTVIFKDTTGSRGPSEIGADDNSVGTNQMSAASIDNTMLGTDALDETKCKWMQLHSSAVAKVVVAPSGHWLLTAGSDGSVFILSTSSRAKGFESAPEALSGDNLVMFTDRAQLLTQMNRIEVIEQKLAEAEADKKRELKALQDNMNATITKINQQVSKEIKLRDDLIIKSRDEQTRVSKALQEEIEALKNNHGKTVQEIEMLYEKRLAEVSN